MGDWLGVWAPPEGTLPPRESTTLETPTAIPIQITEEIPSGWGVCICCTCKEAEDEGAGDDSKEEAEEAEAGDEDYPESSSSKPRTLNTLTV